MNRRGSRWWQEEQLEDDSSCPNRNDGDLDQGGGRGGVGKRQMDLGAILEVELRGPAMDWVYRSIVP